MEDGLLASVFEQLAPAHMKFHARLARQMTVKYFPKSPQFMLLSLTIGKPCLPQYHFLSCDSGQIEPRRS